MGLDINTPKGQESLAHEQRMLDKLHKAFPLASFAQTPKETDADIDGFAIMGKHKIVAAFESKCREMSRDCLKNVFKNEWLVTFEKLQKGAAIARALKVPFVGYLYLVPDDVVLLVRISDEHGNYLPKIRIERTETQKTVNGGTTTRTNAYIDVSGAKEVA